MGNMSSLLDGSYEVDEVFPELTSDGHSSKEGQSPGWSLQLAEDSDGRRVSIFLYPAGKDATNVGYVDNAVKYLKMLRHPGIPKFVDMKRNTKGCMLITEQVTPLASKLKKLTPPEICAGLYNIVEVLAFLHDRGGVCHNDICLSTIFVGSNGRWLLGGLDYMCRFDEATAAYLNKCKSLRNQNALAPEEKEGKLQMTTKCARARDVYSFGVLAEHLLTYLDDLGDLTKTFELRIQDEFLNRDPSLRPQMSTLLQDRLFKIDYLEIVNFLKNITLKTEEEKKTFFSCAARKLFHLPPAVVATRLVRPLLSRFVLLDSTATTCLIPHLLTPHKGFRESDEFRDEGLNPILPEELFRRYVIPEVFRVFHVYNVHIRLTLLRHFESYVHLFAVDTLEEYIFPQILVGLKDSCDELAAASLRAAACLVPILGGDLVISAKRSKIFSGITPNFSRKMNHVQEKATNVVTETMASSGTTSDKAGDPAVDKKEQKKRQLEKRREERRLRKEEKEKKRAEAIHDDVKEVKTDNQRTCSDDDSISDSTSTRQEEHQSHGTSDGTTTDTDDDDFDQEIEEELRAMDSAVVVRQNENTELGPPVMVDWSDVTTSPQLTKHRGGEERGVLRLKGHGNNPDQVVISKKDGERDCSDVGEIRVESSPDDGWSDMTNDRWDTNDDWEDVDTSTKPRSPTSSFKTIVDKAKHKPRTKRLSSSSDAVLGAEFDVMAIEVQKKTTTAVADPIEQLFAEMQPKIAASRGDGILGMLGNTEVNGSIQQSRSDDKQTKQKSSSLFAAKDTPDEHSKGPKTGKNVFKNSEDPDGWGEDLNWSLSDD